MYAARLVRTIVNMIILLLGIDDPMIKHAPVLRHRKLL